MFSYSSNQIKSMFYNMKTDRIWLTLDFTDFKFNIDIKTLFSRLSWQPYSTGKYELTVLILYSSI